jgi:hypothetical protein
MGVGVGLISVLKVPVETGRFPRGLEVTSTYFPSSWPLGPASLTLRQRESASMTLTPSVEQLSVLFAPSWQAFIGGSFFAEHFAVPIKQGTGGRASYGDTFFL